MAKASQASPIGRGVGAKYLPLPDDIVHGGRQLLLQAAMGAWV